MRKVDLKIAHKDERGEIIDLIVNENINAVTLVTCKKGAVRGNHYHKKTTQWEYLISGKIKLVSQRDNEEKVETIVEEGELVITPPNEKHAIVALEDSELMVFTSGPRSGEGYETDTFRLEVPLVTGDNLYLQTTRSDQKNFIPVSEPFIDSLESKFVNDALEKKAISGLFGDYISQFEKEFARFCDCEYGISTSSGTTALHLAMASLGIGRGDEVIVSTYTNMATFFAVLYQGARPVPVDIEPDTWNINPLKIEEKITDKTKAIIVVHIFGHPVDMDPVLELAKKYNLFVVEDCAEAHGATYKGKKVGSIGDIGCFSFYANKIITTGEGGMLVTNNEEIAKKAASLKSLAFGDDNKFMHKDIGFNYRLTNLQAAIGCAQLKKLPRIIESKRFIAETYNKLLSEITALQLPIEKTYATNVYWMYHVVLKENASLSRKYLMSKLLEKGIETRPGFIPFNLQEIFIKSGITHPDECPVANYIAENSFYLPSSPNLTREDLEFIANSIKEII